MSTADEIARILADAAHRPRRGGMRMADLFADATDVVVIPREASKRHGGNPRVPESERPAPSSDERDAVAQIIATELGAYADDWAVQGGGYDAACRAAAERIITRLLRDRPSGTPGDGPDTAPHVRGSDTSKAAARAVAPTLAGKRLVVLTQCMRCASTLLVRGYTDNELTRLMQIAHGWGSNSSRPRRIELTRGGWLEDSGERRNGSTVWRPTEKAWAWWREQQGGGAS